MRKLSYSYLKKSSNFQDIKSQDKTHHLAYENGIGRFRLKPDIVINGGKIIADTKWKILSEDKAYNGVLQDDMYQLYAYGTKYANCEKIYLIYPFDELITQLSHIVNHKFLYKKASLSSINRHFLI